MHTMTRGVGQSLAILNIKDVYHPRIHIPIFKVWLQNRRTVNHEEEPFSLATSQLNLSFVSKTLLFKNVIFL